MRSRPTTTVVIIPLTFWLMAESVYALMQVAGVARSGHIRYAMTGHFLNPGPFGGFVGMLMAVCVACVVLTRPDGKWAKWLRVLCGAGALAGLMVLPASMSRAGWLGLAVAVLVLSICHRAVRAWLRGRRWLWVLIAVAAVVLSAGAFLMKKDSALGRLHIWHMEARGIAAHPWTGAGRGGFAAAYGEAQAAYFRAGERADWEVRVAGCPEYAFNEYLRAGVEWGVGGLVLALAVTVLTCVILVRKDSPLGYGAIALAVFAAFSYPMSLWPFQLCGGLFLAAVLGELSGKRGVALAAFAAGAVICVGVERAKPVKADFRELYIRGYRLFEMGEFEKALPLLEEGAGMSCDPMFHNIIGRCHEAMGKPEQAESAYWQAHFMVPGRLYPLVLLQELYLSQGDVSRAGEMLTMIRNVPVNEKNPNMITLRERAENNVINPILNHSPLVQYTFPLQMIEAP